MKLNAFTERYMAKKRRGRARVLLAIPSRATSAPRLTTCPPLFTFGTTTPSQQLDTPVTALEFPQNVIDNVIDHLHDCPADLCVCSLVARNWTARSQSYLFREVYWTEDRVSGWCKKIRPHPDGPARNTTRLAVFSMLKLDNLAPMKDHFTSFRNIASLMLQDLEFDDPIFHPKNVLIYFGHLRPRLTTLELISANGSCGRLLAFASFFPHLEHLMIAFPGGLVPPDPTIDLEYQPLRGTLFLRGHLNRHTDFIKLLSRVPVPQFHTVRLEHWGRLDTEDLNCLLATCSKSLEILTVSACKGEHPTPFRSCSETGCAEEQFSRLRPNFSLCSRLTELRVVLPHIGSHPPNLMNTLLTSPIVLSRITFVIHGKIEPQDVVISAQDWTETDTTIARFSTKLFCRKGGKRLLLTFRVVGVLDFTPLVPCSIGKGVEVLVEKDDDQELMLPLCVSCETEIYCYM